MRQRGARGVAQVTERVRRDSVKHISGELRQRALVDDHRPLDPFGHAVSREDVVGDSGRGPANGQRRAGIVVDVARQHTGAGVLTDRDRHADRAGHLDVGDPHVGFPDEDTGTQRRRGITNDAEADKLCTRDSCSNDGGICLGSDAGQPDRRSSRHATDEADVVLELQRLAIFTRLDNYDGTGLSPLQRVGNRLSVVHHNGAGAEERQRNLAPWQELPVRLQAKHGRRDDDAEKHDHCKTDSLLRPRSALRHGWLRS